MRTIAAAGGTVDPLKNTFHVTGVNPKVEISKGAKEKSREREKEIGRRESEREEGRERIREAQGEPS